MKVSLKWLNEYVEVPSDIQAFCDKLDLTGTAVEAVERTGDNLRGVVIGHVQTCIPHPDSDHMHVVEVDVGETEPLQIVCGAPNIAADIKVAVATIGTIMPEGFAIKKSKLRGVVSFGMCCSRRELGLGQDHEGIWVLPDNAPVGTEISEYLGTLDTLLDLEITPNRPDCLSVVGMAREVGAMYQVPAINPLSEMAAKLSEDASLPAIKDLVDVEITDSARCGRYSARVIKNVKVGPSPEWLAQRIEASGGRSINNIVDVTNYILYLFGQPLHAFDFDKLVELSEGADAHAEADANTVAGAHVASNNSTSKAHIIVRPAKEGEELITLDEQKRNLTSDMTVIATPSCAAALAGVMGGLETEVTENTTTILLETATFEPGRTSRTSRNLGLMSESSLRYERGVDDNPIADISAASAALIAEVSGGSVAPGIVDIYPQKTNARPLVFRIERFCSMMGANIEPDFIIDILTRLGCEVKTGKTPQELNVLAPTFRPDLEREIDLYEEVLRLYGMDKVVSSLPGSANHAGSYTHEQQKLKQIAAVLRASGLNETITYSFAEPKDPACLIRENETQIKAVELINPINADQSLMRQSIIPGLLRSVSYNISHGVKNVQLFETGKVFFASEGKKKPKEKERISGVLAGAMGEASWNNTPAAFDFFDAKGVVENIARELALPKVRFKVLEAHDAAHLQPGRAAEVLSEGTSLGWVGEIHPLLAKQYDIDVAIAAFELDTHALISASRAARDYVEVPTLPAVQMDVAFVVDEEVTHERMMQCISSAGGKLLESAHLFDIYRDVLRIGPHKKSMAYALVYRDPSRTLTSVEAEKTHERLIKKVCGATGAEVRG